MAIYGNLAYNLETKRKFHNGYTHIYINFGGELRVLETMEYDLFIKNMDKYKGFTDVYASENTLSNVYSRRAEDTLQLRRLYIDIDEIVSRDKAISTINSLADKRVIPRPTMIVFSGRGLNIKWELKDYSAKNKANRKAWEKVQGYLFKVLKSELNEVGKVDHQAKDVARIFRIPGTINSKSGKEVKVLSKNENIYDLYELYNTYTPYEATRHTEKREEKKGVILLKSKGTLNNARLIDFKRILELRGYDMTGIRNKFLMFYTTYFILVNGTNEEDTLQEIKEVSSFIKASKNTSLSELKTLVRNGMKKVREHKEGKKVLPNNETIIEMLEISEEEQMQLSTLKTKEVKYKINNQRRKENRRNDKGLTTREQQKQEKIEVIQELKNKGLSQSKASKESGYSIALIKRYWNI